MHDMPSVTYEDSYKRRGKPWEKWLFFGETLLLDGGDDVKAVITIL